MNWLLIFMVIGHHLNHACAWSYCWQMCLWLESVGLKSMCQVQLVCQCFDVYVFEPCQSHVDDVSYFLMIWVLLFASVLVYVSKCGWIIQLMSLHAIWLGVMHKAYVINFLPSLYNE
jgi:hypothetical protein